MPSASDLLNEFYDGRDFEVAPLTARIESIEPRQLKGFDGREVIKLIIELEGHRRKVVLNKTSGRQLVEQWGDDYDEWVGRYLLLTAVPMVVGGKLKQVVMATPSLARLADEG